MKQKGFTLIELLGVIIVLAIVALILTPLISDVIEETKKNSFLESMRSVAQAIQLQNYDRTEEISYTLKDGVFSPHLELSKEVKGIGTFIYDGQGNIQLYVQNGKWCAVSEFADTGVHIIEGECEANPNIVNADQSGANLPRIDSSMFPIKWDGEHWIKADKNNQESPYQWYDYDQKMWANAAIIKKNKRDSYHKAKLGTIISEEDVVAYLVWIPRFEYSISSEKGPSEIQVHFIKENITTSQNESFHIHPAFSWDNSNLKGFWIGKFETTGTIEQLTILPNQKILKNISLATMYQAVSDLNNLKDKDEYENKFAAIHLLKNIEWGATAYLSHSKYGLCTEGICHDVAKNKNANITGYASGQNTYETPEAVTASTTGNIYGVYDMNGGTWEFTMGTDDLNSGKFKTDVPATFYDDYQNISDGKLGDATYETKGWYNAGATYLYPSVNWFIRGGDANTANASLFFYGADRSGGGYRNGFRLALVAN